MVKRRIIIVLFLLLAGIMALAFIKLATSVNKKEEIIFRGAKLVMEGKETKCNVVTQKL